MNVRHQKDARRLQKCWRLAQPIDDRRTICVRTLTFVQDMDGIKSARRAFRNQSCNLQDHFVSTATPACSFYSNLDSSMATMHHQPPRANGLYGRLCLSGVFRYVEHQQRCDGITSSAKVAPLTTDPKDFGLNQTRHQRLRHGGAFVLYTKEHSSTTATARLYENVV